MYLFARREGKRAARTRAQRLERMDWETGEVGALAASRGQAPNAGGATGGLVAWQHGLLVAQGGWRASLLRCYSPAALLMLFAVRAARWLRGGDRRAREGESTFSHLPRLSARTAVHSAGESIHSDGANASSPSCTRTQSLLLPSR